MPSEAATLLDVTRSRLPCHNRYWVPAGEATITAASAGSAAAPTAAPTWTVTDAVDVPMRPAFVVEHTVQGVRTRPDAAGRESGRPAMPMVGPRVTPVRADRSTVATCTPAGPDAASRAEE